MKWIGFCFAFALSTLSFPASGKPIKPEAAYLLVDVQSLDDALMQGTSEPGVITLGRYDPKNGDIRGGDSSPETALPRRMSPHLVIGGKPTAKAGKSRQYLIEVEPDTWVVEGANGTAFSLGSYEFVVQPGQVLDLGVFKPQMDWAEGEKAKSQGDALLGAILFARVQPKNLRPVKLLWRARATEDFGFPPELASRKVDQVSFQKGAKFGNYLGGLVNRIGGRAERFQQISAEIAADTGTTGEPNSGTPSLPE